MVTIKYAVLHKLRIDQKVKQEKPVFLYVFTYASQARGYSPYTQYQKLQSQALWSS